MSQTAQHTHTHTHKRNLTHKVNIGLAKAFEGVSLKGCPIRKVQKLWLCGTSMTSLKILDTSGGLQ